MNGLSDVSVKIKSTWPNSSPDVSGLPSPRPGRVRPGKRSQQTGSSDHGFPTAKPAVAVGAGLSEAKFILVGFGPHCRRTHISFFKKHNMRPAVIVELESARESAQALIKEMNWPTKLVTIADDSKNELHLPAQAVEQLDGCLRRYGITHAVIASEPKGHLMYLRYFLERGLDILADKPIVAFAGLNEPERVDQLKETFAELVKAWSTKSGQLKLLCQRSEHIGYGKIFQLLGQVIEEFDVPITHLNINACDGNWLMPHDFNYENHPYKYGYGKLFHSGYHYVALLSNFLELNRRVSADKRISQAELGGHFVRPDDLLTVITPDNLAAMFADYDPGLTGNLEMDDLSRYGECDFMANLRLMNSAGRTISTAGLNVLQSGFSRRAWHPTKADRYKGNGRVRHEHVNVHVGPLMNIQVHSYQAKECRDRSAEEWQAGGLDHFDIDVYRNTGILGGPLHERFTVRDLHDFSGEEYFVGLNELAREKVLLDFFYRRKNGADLNRHLAAMEIFCQLCALQANFTKTNRMETRHFQLAA